MSYDDRLLRMRIGEYASRDGRFYAARDRGGLWRALDAGRVPYVVEMLPTLRACRRWFRARWRIRR